MHEAWTSAGPPVGKLADCTLSVKGQSFDRRNALFGLKRFSDYCTPEPLPSSGFFLKKNPPLMRPVRVDLSESRSIVLNISTLLADISLTGTLRQEKMYAPCNLV